MTEIAASSWRSPERAAAVVMRTTRERRNQLKAEAARQGMSLQAYCEWRLLGLEEPPAERAPGRPRSTDVPFEGLSMPD